MGKVKIWVEPECGLWRLTVKGSPSVLEQLPYGHPGSDVASRFCPYWAEVLEELTRLLTLANLESLEVRNYSD